MLHHSLNWITFVATLTAASTAFADQSVSEGVQKPDSSSSATIEALKPPRLQPGQKYRPETSSSSATSLDNASQMGVQIKLPLKKRSVKKSVAPNPASPPPAGEREKNPSN